MLRTRTNRFIAAQDVAQDTIFAVIEALRVGRVRDLDRLPAFVMGTARNLINNRLRCDKQRAEVLGDPPDEPSVGSVSDEPSLTPYVASHPANAPYR